MAVLKRPSTVEEIIETAWKLFAVYATKIGCRVRRHSNFVLLMEKMVRSSLDSGRLHSVCVGMAGDATEYVWLEGGEWPDVRERERMERYRTVSQVRQE